MSVRAQADKGDYTGTLDLPWSQIIRRCQGSWEVGPQLSSQR